MTGGGPTARVAAIDMGSNTTRLMIADVTRDEAGVVSHSPVLRRTAITRLAEQVDSRGILVPTAIARTRNALIEYRQQARAHGAVFVLATATSAVRDADNGEAFLGEIEYGFGFRTMLLSGEQEASATFDGVSSDAGLAARAREGRGWLIDIGGGSTEIVVSERGTLVDHHSFQLGSVRLTEQLLASNDPPTTSDLRAAEIQARGMFATRFPLPATPELAVGVAGTVTTVAAITHGLDRYDPTIIHGTVLTPEDVRGVLGRLAALPLAERAAVTGLEPQRAPVILGGLAVLCGALDHFAVGELVVSESDILDGIVRLAGTLAIEEGITEMPEPFGRTIC